MNTPIPTPFDIIDPGPGALVPTGVTWIALAACAIIVLLYTAYRRRTPSAHSIHATLRALIDELRVAAAQSNSEQGLERVTRLARRVLTPYTSGELATMSCSELRSMSASLGRSSDEAAISLSPLLGQLAELEEQAYAPQTSEASHVKLRELCTDLISGLEAHVRRFRPS
jgi:hypothetical protein